MSTDCENCIVYCTRHGIKKPQSWIKLCKTNKAYFNAWEKGTGPGQTEKLAARMERRAKVVAAREKTERLIGWLTFLRQPQDDGVGDTANRLKMLASNPSDVHTAIKRLMSQCSCQPVDAIARLNREWPYS